MATREAACLCGQLRLEVEGEPFAVSICNCLDCQRRTGSAFGMQAGFRPNQVQISGTYKDYSKISDEADRKEHVLHFCPECGSPIFTSSPRHPEHVYVKAGTLDDPSLVAPAAQIWVDSSVPWSRIDPDLASFAKGRT